MAEGLNRVLLFGNLGADPELRSTSGGQSVLNLRLATSESWLDKNRVRQERTEWHSVVVWGKRAEALSKFLAKGARVFVEGSLRTSSYEDREGNKRYRTEVVAQNIILGGRSGNSSRSDDGDAQEQAPPERRSGNEGAAGGDEIDDIPF